MDDSQHCRYPCHIVITPGSPCCFSSSEHLSCKSCCMAWAVLGSSSPDALVTSLIVADVISPSASTFTILVNISSRHYTHLCFFSVIHHLSSQLQQCRCSAQEATYRPMGHLGTCPPPRLPPRPQAPAQLPHLLRPQLAAWPAPSAVQPAQRLDRAHPRDPSLHLHQRDRSTSRTRSSSHRSRRARRLNSPRVWPARAYGAR